MDKDTTVVITSPQWGYLWVTIIGVLGALDAWRNTKHDGSTLSEVTRKAFRVDTPRGRLGFLAVLTGGAVALALHICKPLRP